MNQLKIVSYAMQFAGGLILSFYMPPTPKGFACYLIGALAVYYAGRIYQAAD